MAIAVAFHPGAILSVLAFGLLIGWIVWRWSRRSEDPPGILTIKIVFTLALGGIAIWSGVKIHPLIGIPLAAALAIVIGILWGRNVGAAIARPLSSMYDGGDEAPEPRAFYAIAEAHRKQARYADAIVEIEKQLDRFPGDVEGLLMLAEIRARHLGDWRGAGVAIDLVAGNEDLPVPTRAKALQALADWHLDHAGDTAAASECLRQIQTLFPDTPEANEAAQRLAHVGDGAWRREQRAPSRLRLTPGDPHLGLRTGTVEVPRETDANQEAHSLLAQLSVHPLDTETRERLALLYADRLGRLDWAVGEIEKLVSQPNQPPRAVSRWLHLLADVQVRCAGDEAAARTALERITRLYPESAVSANAQARLDYLKLELRGRQPSRVVGAATPPRD